MVNEDVLFEQRGRLGVITLNRPRVINAIDHGMVKAVRRRLDTWRIDSGVAAVLLRGAGDRGLCAGGDIVSIARSIAARDLEAVFAFWRDEYALDHLISRFPKPVIAFMDGIVLGGGMGISAHASHRIVTQTSRLGFPETAIGFVPDVGASWLLPRAPGELGTFMALTGRAVGAGDGLAFGFADYFVRSERLNALARELESVEVEVALGRFSEPAPEPILSAERVWIDIAFAGAEVDDIVQRLRTSTAEGAGVVAEELLARSPVSVAVALAAVRRASELPDLGTALQREFVVSTNALRGHDFAEGIRARLIDKDQTPSWSPESAAEVKRGDVEAHFELGPGIRSLDFPDDNS